jgi:hypothetical protein
MALGLTKTESVQLSRTVGKWIEHSGIEWTVDHLKELKLLYLHKLAGTKFKSTHWIAKDPDGLPKGAIKAIFKLSRKNLSRVLTALTGYSEFVSDSVTQKQEKKFFSSMCSTDTRGMNAKISSSFMGVSGVLGIRTLSEPLSILEYCTSPNKRAPYPNGKTGPETDVVSVLEHAMGSVSVRRIMEYSPDIFRKVIPFDVCQSLRPKPWSTDYSLVDTLGFISGIQEPGYKLRAVANPSRVLQAVLEPLKNFVNEILLCLETDCTHDQQKAIPAVQEWLSERRTVYSVDLSDATNLFPWPLQREFLRDVTRILNDRDRELAREYIDIMDKCATGPWLTRLRGQPEVVKFTRGQPLGLGPSFGTFALSHNFLLKGICDKHGIEPRFRVLGDDVIIADSSLHRIYRKSLDNLGCRVSLSKTFESKIMAEFAGTTILADRVGHGYKWRQMSDYSFIDAARNLGKPSLGMMNPFQREVTNLLSPLPKCIGGIGWSDGRKLSELVSPILDYAVMYNVEKDPHQPMMYRDLVADTRALAQALSYSPSQSKMFRVNIQMEGGDKIAVSDLLRSHRLIGVDESVTLPSPLVTFDGCVPLDKRYYPIVDRGGDPRPSMLPLVRAIASFSRENDQPLSKRVERWVNVAIRNKPQLNIDKQVKKTPDNNTKTKVQKSRGDFGMSF